MIYTSIKQEHKWEEGLIMKNQINRESQEHHNQQILIKGIKEDRTDRLSPLIPKTHKIYKR